MTTTIPMKLDASTWATWDIASSMIYGITHHLGVRLPINSRWFDRKCRLFCCAAFRRKWTAGILFRTLAEELDAVEQAEKFADGVPSLMNARSVSLKKTEGNRCRLMAWRCCWKRADNAAYAIVGTNHDLHRGVSADLLREVFANPFMRREWGTLWRTWNDGAVPKLAQTIYQRRAWGELGILADAAEEAGIEDVDLLAHLRSDGQRYLGDWAVDLLRGQGP